MYGGMARKQRKKIKDDDLQGFKYFKVIQRLLRQLHEHGCECDRAGNRKLHMDQLVALLLLYMFNPICSSLRAIQQASELKKVQRLLNTPRASLGSLSEAAHVFDSALLVEVIEELAAQVPHVPHDKRLDDVGQIITLVDGTWMKTLPRLVNALWVKPTDRKIKAHVQFEVLKGVPVSATITRGQNLATDERTVLAEQLQAGRLYVKDRGYAKYSLLQRIINARSSFVCRIRDDAVFEVIESRDLSAEATEVGVVEDKVVRLGGSKSGLKVPVRIIRIKCTPHPKSCKGGRGGPKQGETLLIATDRLDLPAEVISLIYQHRWQIEIFFRFFKHILGCRHLLSYADNGIELQVYTAIIACLLIALWTGRKPTLRTYEMFCWRLMGMADDDELSAHIAKLRDQSTGESD